MKNALLILLIFSAGVSFSQNCTINASGTYNWPADAGASVPCVEGGFALGKSVLIIPSGLLVNFSGGDTWSGTTIQVIGRMTVLADVTLNTSLLVKSGGRVTLNAKLDLGSSAGCGYNAVIQSGGLINVGGTGSERLSICGQLLMKGNGSCNDCGGTNSGTCAYNGSPYCEPSTGFVGPVAYDDTGYNQALPITLKSFTANVDGQIITLGWVTSMEKNFSKFIIQRSGTGLVFEDIGEVASQGRDIQDVETEYTFVDSAPLIDFNYYRLKEVDLDETIKYSNIVTTKFSGHKALAVYPNPLTGESISFKTNFNPSESDRLIVTNHLGIEIANVHVASLTDNNLSFASKLFPGVYMLKYVSKDFERTVKVVVKN